MTKQDVKLSKLQKALLGTVCWQLERNEFAIVDFGKYKDFSVRTLKSLVDRGILCYSDDNKHYLNKSMLGMKEDCYYIKKQNPKKNV